VEKMLPKTSWIVMPTTASLSVMVKKKKITNEFFLKNRVGVCPSNFRFPSLLLSPGPLAMTTVPGSFVNIEALIVGTERTYYNCIEY